MDILKLLIEYGIIGILLSLGFIVIYIAFERNFAFNRIELSQFKNKNSLEKELSRNMTLLYTIAANAVYIGLLGTVLGIMLTFSEMGSTQAMIDSAKIMKSLSYALIATAAGLCVAIPAMVIYNFLSRQCELIVGEWETHYGI